MKLYVGNLSYQTTAETLEAQFGAFGKVDDVFVVKDRETGRPRGFAFVTMSVDEEARNAIEQVNGMQVDGRTLTVNEARPREERGGGGGGGGGGRPRRDRGSGGGGGGGHRSDRW